MTEKKGEQVKTTLQTSKRSREVVKDVKPRCKVVNVTKAAEEVKGSRKVVKDIKPSCKVVNEVTKAAEDVRGSREVVKDVKPRGIVVNDVTKAAEEVKGRRKIAARRLQTREHEIGCTRCRRRRDLDDSPDDAMRLLREKLGASGERFDRLLESRPERQWEHARRLDEHLKRGSRTTTFTNEDAELEVQQRDSSRLPQGDIVQTDPQESGESAARNVLSPKPPDRLSLKWTARGQILWQIQSNASCFRKMIQTNTYQKSSPMTSSYGSTDCGLLITRTRRRIQLWVVKIQADPKMRASELR
ncbi:hypothetical protein CEXT_507041 [Caerostris extrusa]|uniref:Uncharacterized protein n=1 Tax=Caerostris extrusa TaxID=172846 RepID=A0AAV4P3X5_CAEEX|nr:hypothetical protein CEXT_507041 [Caerostris extrusa]